MPLEELVNTIESLKGSIELHQQLLRQSEALTRYVVIDPLLRAIGWDTEDPEKVRPEYPDPTGRPDYALFVDGKPVSMVEAKSLATPLDETVVRRAMEYCTAQGVRYTIVTNGDRWELYHVFQSGSFEERRLLALSILTDPAHQCALKFLMIWRPNLASGQPVEANAPILAGTSPATTVVEPVVDTGPPAPAPPSLPGEGWTSLAEFRFTAGSPAPSVIRFPGEAEREAGRWNRLLLESAEYLIRTGKLTPLICPVPVPGSARYSVHREAIHSDGKGFTVSRKLSNGLLCEVNVSGSSAVTYTKSLLQHCGQDLATIWLKLD